jgi:hypothetical protein
LRTYSLSPESEAEVKICLQANALYNKNVPAQFCAKQKENEMKKDKDLENRLMSVADDIQSAIEENDLQTIIWFEEHEPDACPKFRENAKKIIEQKRRNALH